MLAGWYLRHFSCEASVICSAEADALLEAARTEQAMAERRTLLAQADRLLTDATAFIPLTAPVRWSLVSPRLSGFQVNPFSRHLPRSKEHTSELQSLMRTSYAVFCLKKTRIKQTNATP